MSHQNRTRGLALAAIGGLALSLDIPLIRLSGGDVWSVQFVRGLMIAPIGLIAWLLARRFAGWTEPLMPGRLSLPIAFFYALSSALFFFAVFNTSTANLVFILAFNPMIAALFGWVLMKERPAPQTFLAMAVMLFGVFIIVKDGLAAGNWQGDFAALLSAASIACAITLSRKSGRNHGFTVMMAQIGPVLISLPFIFGQGVNVPEFGWMMLNGMIFLPLAFFCLAAAPRFIGAAESAMFYLLETVLAPVWVWFVFAEKPTENALLGGGVLLAALIVHTVWEMRRERLVEETVKPN
jgi:drug/metabolite transporter (DMT)-like permease